MKYDHPTAVRLFTLLAMLVLIPQPAYAYIDPGIGSLVFQSAIAGFVVIAGAWAALKLKISSLFGKDRRATKDRGQQDDPS